MNDQNNPNQTDSFKQNDSSMPGGGPQFGLEEKEGWISRYGGSVVLPIIALLILAGGIYLYASQQSEKVAVLSEEETPLTIRDEIADLEQEILQDVGMGAAGDEIVISTQEDDGKVIIEKIIPEEKRQGGSIIETAAKGDGVTHLARRALKHYLESQPRPQNLTNEHRVFVEDYIKDKTSSQPLEVGEEVSFSEDLIAEAIDASLQLIPEQLENLEQYSALVAW